MASQVIEFFFGEAEHKVIRKPLDIPADLSGQLSCFNAVQFRKVAIYHHLLASDEKDTAGNPFAGYRYEFFFCCRHCFEYS